MKEISGCWELSVEGRVLLRAALLVSPSRVTALPELGGTEEKKKQEGSPVRSGHLHTEILTPRPACISGRNFFPVPLYWYSCCSNAFLAVMLVGRAFSSKLCEHEQ